MSNISQENNPDEINYDDIDLSQYMTKVSPEELMEFKIKKLSKEDMTQKLKDVNSVEVFQIFTEALLSKMDEMTNTVNNKIDEQGNKIDALTKQISKMNEAFDKIMADYFLEVQDGISTFSVFVRDIVHDIKNNTLTDKQVEELLLSRLELLKDRTDLIETQTVSFSSELMQGIYEDIIPNVKKEIDGLYDKIVEELHGMHEAGINTTSKNAINISNTILKIERNLIEHSQRLSAKITNSEESLKVSLSTGRRNSLG